MCVAAVVVAGALAVPALAATKSVKVGDNYFVKNGTKPTVTIRKGTTVKWRWTGTAPHNVTVTKGPVKFHSKTQTKGSFAKKLTKRGTYTVVCTIHLPDMKMTLKVK
jgi:plastocyanin